MSRPARPLQPHCTFRNGPRRQGCAGAGAKRVRSNAHAAPPLTAPGRCEQILLIVGGGALWRAHHSVAPAGRGATAGQNKPDKPRAKKSGQLDLLTTYGGVRMRRCGRRAGVVARRLSRRLNRPGRNALRSSSAVDESHGRGGVTLARRHAVWKDLPDAAQIVGRQVNLERPEVLFQVPDVLGPGDGHDIGVLAIRTGLSSGAASQRQARPRPAQPL